MRFLMGALADSAIEVPLSRPAVSAGSAAWP